MPWRETSRMDERLRFVQDAHRPGWSIAELCRRYEVSRKTGYKWLEVYERADACRHHRQSSSLACVVTAA
jgi:transposase-like protein